MDVSKLSKNAFELIRSLAILYLMLFLGEWVTRLVPIGIPASIVGLLILFLCLTTQIIRVSWIFFGASLIIRYMAILFVPVSVGIMKYSDLLVSQAKALLIPNVVSSMVTLVVVGLLGDYLFSLTSFKHLRKKVVKRRNKEQNA
ncbi:MAG: CidA/LrgA family protein [[Actinobacillus] rossii]|nr:CidA/LrgA family protein [[Actinobacillus] rossii]MDY4505063.1 CidA/LrgA family protein [[Actinobacillus] rossii]